VRVLQCTERAPLAEESNSCMNEVCGLEMRGGISIHSLARWDRMKRTWTIIGVKDVAELQWYQSLLAWRKRLPVTTTGSTPRFGWHGLALSARVDAHGHPSLMSPNHAQPATAAVVFSVDDFDQALSRAVLSSTGSKRAPLNQAPKLRVLAPNPDDITSRSVQPN